MFGTIVMWNEAKGYGFISAEQKIENGAKIVQSFFFHITNFKENERPALNGMVVFNVGDPISIGKKPQALAVRYATAQEVDEVSQAASRSSVVAMLSGKGGVGGGQ